jgi:hypothetical protein
MKYTQDVLTPIVAESYSLADVIRKLGGKWSGGRQQHIRRLLIRFNIDTSHFLGQGSNRGKNHKGGPTKKSSTEIFVVLPEGSQRQKVSQLRRAMIEVGIPYRCNICGLGNCWFGKPIILEVDHIDGNWYNNKQENLQFICPNCHSQK